MRYLIIFLMLALPAVAYEVYQYKDLKQSAPVINEERLLFILDFSQSMAENCEAETKSLMVRNVLQEYLTKVPQNIPIGLRVYGHKCGFTAMQACRASELVVPISTNGNEIILSKLERLNPRGMTPITYSLKQAVANDFGDYQGRKHIILFTDGGENCDESPCRYAIELSKLRKDFIIDVIAFNVGDKDDLEQLECTALVTKGEFYQAETKADLVNILDRIVDKQKRVDAKIYNTK